MRTPTSTLCLAVITLCCSSCLHGAGARGMTVLSSELKHPIATPMAQAVSVGDVSGGTKTSQMWLSQVDNDALRAALSDSLKVGGLLAEGPGRYTLSAVLVSMNQPLVGFDMSVTASVWCTLVDTSTGAVVWQDMFADSSTKTLTPSSASFDCSSPTKVRCAERSPKSSNGWRQRRRPRS